MTDYSDLIREIKGECPGAPDPIIIQQIANTAIEFCRDTRALKRTLDPITVTADEPLYALTPPVGTTIVQVQNAQISDYPMLRATSTDLLDIWWREGCPLADCFCDCGWNTDDSGTIVVPRGTNWRQFTQDAPEAFYVDQENNEYRIRLVGIPTTTIADSLVVRVSLTPTRDATSLDAWLIEQYFDTLCEGAKGRLMRMPKKTWTDIPTAKYYLDKFDTDKGSARLESLRDFVRDDESTGHVTSWP
jgi:hypothetical protein